MPIKKKVSAPVKAEDDEILGDLMEEINDSKPIEKKEISSKEYLKSLQFVSLLSHSFVMNSTNIISNI